MMAQDDSEILDRSVAHAGFLTVERYRLRHRLFGGGWTPPLEREVCLRGSAAGVLPYDPERDELVLVEQFRMGPYAAGEPPWMIEIVAGFIEAGETPAAGATREGVEECGCAGSAPLPVTSHFPSPRGLGERMHPFCGRVGSRQGARPG